MELSAGSAYNASSPLRIRQGGAPDLRLTARYATRPWTGAPYYAYRLGRWSPAQRAWELELVHHKLYLTNPPPEVQRFEVTHAYNLLLVNRAVRVPFAIVRTGLGAVVAHPENTVRGRPLAEARGRLGGGYYLAGPAGQVAVAHHFRLRGGWGLSLEGKLSGAYARVPVQGGDATVPNAAAHALFGVGYAF